MLYAKHVYGVIRKRGIFQSIERSACWTLAEVDFSSGSSAKRGSDRIGLDRRPGKPLRSIGKGNRTSRSRIPQDYIVPGHRLWLIGFNRSSEDFQGGLSWR